MLYCKSFPTVWFPAVTSPQKKAALGCRFNPAYLKRGFLVFKIDINYNVFALK
jgi:hypothetical protein